MAAFPEGKYRELHLELSGLLTEDWISNLANFSASVFGSLPDLNWCGFYLVRGATGPTHLKLGPFQGRPACLDIPFDRGVCGKAARTRATVIVEDVHEFPGHIACDERSRSELVVPLIKDGRVIGVLDLDSPNVGRFSSADAAGLEGLVALLLEKTNWPAQI
ncbi:MAG: GAF domain-containing protein [Deltaproteobacteria bacterium]|nr:GAF domain-containing protein [Deltaproteobacteria bacterium]